MATLDAWFEYWADDIDYRAAEGALDDRSPMHGKEAVRAYAQDWLDTFDDFRFETSNSSTQGKTRSSRS